jgi:hypothetical protein
MALISLSEDSVRTSAHWNFRVSSDHKGVMCFIEIGIWVNNELISCSGDLHRRWELIAAIANARDSCKLSRVGY